MNTMKRKERKKSILYRYIASYVSIVLLSSCVLISFSSYSTAAQLNAEIRQHQNYQLSLLADDLQRRYDEMASIALDIAISAEFKPLMFRRSAYYETSLLAALAKYSGRTLLDSGLFLIYDAMDSVYTETAKYSSEIYMRTILDSKNPAALMEELRAKDNFCILKDGDFSKAVQLWCFPVRILGEQSGQDQAKVVFLVQNSAYQADFERVAGELPGKIQVYYQDLMLADVGSATDVDEKNVFSARSSLQPFSLSMAPYNVRLYNHALQQSRQNLLLVALVLGMLGVGVIVAIRNYRPIRRVYEKQTVREPDSGAQNELEALEMTLDRYAVEREKDSQRLSDQLQMLRRQMLRLILSGREQDPQSAVAKELGILFPHECYFVSVVISASGTAQTEDSLIRIAREISCSAFCCYATLSDRGDLVAVLFNTADPALRKEAVERLAFACAQENLAVICGVSSCAAQIEQLRLCFMEAVSALNAAGTASIMYYEDIQIYGDMLSEQNAKLDLLNAALRTGDSQNAQSLLDDLMAYIQGCTPSIPLQLYFCARILNELVQTSNRLNLPLRPEHLGWLYTSTNVESFHEGMTEIVWEICDARLNRADAEEGSYAQRIVSFVDEHFLDYAMSLDMLADHFSMSASQISRIFKAATNEAFKDYVVRKRIAQAQRLIQTENIPIAELCARVGYTNVSHFIKVFKAQIGVTPAAYRNNNRAFHPDPPKKANEEPTQQDPRKSE